VPLPGKKEISARRVSHAHPLLCYLFCFTLFLLEYFYQKYKKKLVPSIVIIFVGLLLSCFIMLSIDGWFL
jgi:Na+/citrate or Na+/malate symporter